MRRYTFTGVDRSGNGRGGCQETRNLPAVVERRFIQGWRWLRVHADGEQVAGIGPHPDTGIRTWWASREGEVTEGDSG